MVIVFHLFTYKMAVAERYTLNLDIIFSLASSEIPFRVPITFLVLQALG